MGRNNQQRADYRFSEFLLTKYCPSEAKKIYEYHIYMRSGYADFTLCGGAESGEEGSEVPFH